MQVKLKAMCSVLFRNYCDGSSSLLGIWVFSPILVTGRDGGPSGLINSL